MGEAILLNKSTKNKSDYNWMYAFNDSEFIENIFPDIRSYTGYELEILDYAYYEYKSIGYAYFPSCYKRIGSHAFENCKFLTTISITSNYYDPDGQGSQVFYEIGDNAFANCKRLTSFMISTIRKLGKRVFYNCENLSTIYFTYNTMGSPYDSRWMNTIGEEAFANCINLSQGGINNLFYVGEIGKRAFYNCTRLSTNGYLGYSLCFKIDDYAFEKCVNLSSIEMNYSFNAFPSSVNLQLGSHIFEDCSSLKNISLYGHFSIESNTFGNINDNLEKINIIIPYGASTYIHDWNLSTTIKSHAFENYTSLISVNISAIDTIEEYGFYECINLSSVSIGNWTCSEIKEYAFANCSSLQVLYINTLAYSFGWYTTSRKLKIRSHAFDNCTSLRYIDLYACESIPDSLFTTTPNLSHISIGVLSYSMGQGFGYKYSVNIGNYAFYGLSKLSEIYCSYVNTIGSHAFENCTISNLYVGHSLCKEIKEYAFKSVSNLHYLSFNMSCSNMASGPSIQLIVGSHAFEDCFDLNILSLHNVISIGESFINGCNHLSYLYIYYSNGISTIDSTVCEAIRTRPIEGLYINGCLSIPSDAFSNMFTLRTVSMYNALSIGDNAFINCGGLNYVSLFACSKITSMIFNNCPNLQTLRLYFCREIESHAFQSHSKIYDVYGGGMLESARLIVGEYAFENCSSLCQFDGAALGVIGSHAFDNCINLSYFQCWTGYCESIYEYAFYNCSKILSFLDGNISLNYIGSHAFENCTSLSYIRLAGISSIPYLESIDAFNNIDPSYIVDVPSSMYQDFINDSIWGLISEHISIAQ